MICADCGTDVAIGDWPFCPHGPTGAFASQGDEQDYWCENMGPEPVHIRSKTQKRYLMEERGLQECVRHVDHPNGSRYNKTVDWTGRMDDYTAKNKRELLERAFLNAKPKKENRPMFIPDNPDLAEGEFEQIMAMT